MISFSEKLNFRILWGLWCGTTLKLDLIFPFLSVPGDFGEERRETEFNFD